MRIRSRVPKFIIFLVFIAIVAIGVEWATCFNDHTYIVTITDKDRIVDPNTSNKDKNDIKSKYIVFTEDESGKSRTFENTDVFIRFKWNSSDVQGSLKINHKYRLTVIGYRIPFMSSYENILKAEEVK